MPRSKQHDMPRKPRVHITYDVETNGASVKREIPFVVGVMGDFSGNPTTPLTSLSDRKFVAIDRDNFDEIMSNIAPELNIRVNNRLSQDDDSELAVQLKFKSMADFEPDQIVQQVPSLLSLLESRNRLRDLLTNLDQSEALESALEQLLDHTEQLQSVANDLHTETPAPSNEGGDA